MRARVRSPAKVCAPRRPPWRRCTQGAHPRQTGQLTQLSTSRAPWSALRSAPWCAPILGTSECTMAPTKVRTRGKPSSDFVRTLEAPTKVRSPAKACASKCAPGANRAPTSYAPWSAQKVRNPAKVCAPRANRAPNRAHQRCTPSCAPWSTLRSPPWCAPMLRTSERTRGKQCN